MDANQIRQLKPMLTRYLKRFDNWFSGKDTRANMPVYVAAQLSELKQKSCEGKRPGQDSNLRPWD
jgi:hypothetical protein